MNDPSREFLPMLSVGLESDPLEWFELGTRPQERVEQLRGAVRGKRV